MKRLILLLAVSSQLVAPSLWAQTTTATKTVSKTISGNALTEDLTVPSGKTLTVATGGTATAPAWFLNTFNASTITTGQNGLGWDENGRVTLQTPVGALQFYQTGSPAVPVIYWPGTIVSDTIEANTVTGGIPASSITSPTGSEAIDVGIIARSLLMPMSAWMGLQEYAGANGIPYVSDAQGTSGSLEATDGVYFPQAVVSGQSTTTSFYSGRYRTATQVKSDLAIAATDLTATGTKDSTTYLRGDNTWATISAGAVTSVAGRTGAVTLTTADVSGLGSAATTASSAYDAAGAATTAQAAAIAASQPRAASRLVSTSGALTFADAVIVCTGAGGITLTLPAANAATPRPLQLEIINRTSGTVTLVRAGSDLFEGDTSALISTGASWSITSDASANWYLY